MRRTLRFALILATACGSSLRPSAQALAAIEAATTWFVDGVGCCGAGSGTELDPFCTIQEALDSASSGDTVVVRPGLYAEDLQLPAVRLRLLAPGGRDQTELRGVDSWALRLAPGARLWLEGFTVTGAHGGLTASAAKLTLRACRLIDCQGYVGGALSTQNSDLVVRETDFENTRAALGGALAAQGGRVRIDRCRFENQGGSFENWRGGALWLQDVDTGIKDSRFDGFGVLDDGAALYAEGGRLVVEDSTFSGNFVFDYRGAVAIVDADAGLYACSFLENESDLGWGGAVFVSVGPEHVVELLDCVFDRNAAAEGGALCVRRGTVDLERCTFAANEAGTSFYSERGHGGGVFVGAGPGQPAAEALVRARYCEFLHNVALGHRFLNDGQGGGLFGPAELQSCTLFRNRAEGFFGDGPTGGALAGGAVLHSGIAWDNLPESLAAGVLADWSDVEGGWPGTGNLDADPLFWNRERGDLHLLPRSPCIDRGDPALTDPDGSRLDVGAHPFDPRHGDRDGAFGACPQPAGALRAALAPVPPRPGGPEALAPR